MDTITYSERSMEGCKYETVLRCKATHYLISFYLRLKSDLVEQFRAFLTHIRKGHLLSAYPYQIICLIEMDNDGIWEFSKTNVQLWLIWSFLLPRPQPVAPLCPRSPEGLPRKTCTSPGQVRSF